MRLGSLLATCRGPVMRDCDPNASLLAGANTTGELASDASDI